MKLLAAILLPTLVVACGSDPFVMEDQGMRVGSIVRAINLRNGSRIELANGGLPVTAIAGQQISLAAGTIDATTIDFSYVVMWEGVR